MVQSGHHCAGQHPTSCRTVVPAMPLERSNGLPLDFVHAASLLAVCQGVIGLTALS